MPEIAVAPPPDAAVGLSAQGPDIADTTSQPSVPAVPDSSVTKPDSADSERETKATVQQGEIGRVVNVLMLQRGKALLDMDPQERNAAYASDPANRDIVTFYRLNGIASPGVFRTAEKPYGEPVAEDNRPMIITINGQRRMITFLDSTDGKSFFVRTVPEGGKPGGEGEKLHEKGIPIEEIFQAQLQAVRETLLSSQQFSVDERAVLELYIAQAAGDQGALDRLGTVEVDGFIRRAARGILLTTQDLKALVDVQLPQAGHKQPDGTSKPLSPAEFQQRETVLKLLEVKNLADYDTTVRFLGAMGVTPDSIGQQVSAAESAIKAIKEKMLTATTTEEQVTLQQQLKDAQGQIEILRQAAGAFGENGPLRQYFDKADRGEVDVQQASKFIDALRKGNMQEAIAAIIPEDPNDTPEIRAAKQAQRERMEKLVKQGKMVGIGLLILLFLGNMGFSSLSKQEG